MRPWPFAALVIIPACAQQEAAENPKQLWLHGIHGSEQYLELVETGPPSPF